ncbi:MAG: DNA-binding NarL/FixJ family response regulator [Cellvibrionaceae bacterium]|jgi:DNA-binding NarL/FixJ family response regulator
MAISRRILLVDDHFVARSGVGAVLERAGHTIVGEAGNGLEALKLLSENRIDLIVVDLAMPQMGGHELIRIVTKRFPQAKIVVLSSLSDPESVATAIQDGAKGYILKTGLAQELLEAVEVISLGQRFLGKPMSQNGIDFYQHIDLENHGLEQLTSRERQIIQLVAEGRTSDEIGLMLDISRRTVEKHRNNIMSKMGFENLSELIRFALKNRLITDE